MVPGTRIEHWSSSVHPVDHKSHYSFDLESITRGCYAGPCGFSAAQIAWHHIIDLTGDGPVYAPNQIRISLETLNVVEIRSGTISVDLKHQRVTIDLRVITDGSEQPFHGNGTFRIRA